LDGGLGALPYSINIRSDNQSSQKIRDLWSRCAQLESQPSMVSMRYPPHFTFAVFDEVEEAQLTSAVEAVSSALSQVRVGFDRIGYFDGSRSLVLWAAPAKPNELAYIHRLVHVHTDGLQCRTNYLPGNWIPHCSLAVSVDPAKRSEAMALTQAKIARFEVVFDIIDCARFHPVEVIYETKLRVAV